MKLEIFKQMAYISPSSLGTWESCEYKVFMQKLSGLVIPRGETSYAAQVGIGFGAYVADYIVQKRSMKAPHTHLAITLKGLGDDAKLVARSTAKAYIDAGCCERFLEATEIKLEQELYGIVSGVPILGRIDIIVDGVPEDWKCRGFNSKAYPTKGYLNRMDWCKVGKTKEHKAGHKEPSSEIANERWHTQMAMYNWLLNNTHPTYIIHEICNQDKKLVFVEHHGVVTSEFRQSLMERLEKMWEAITSQLYYSDVRQPRPSPYVCEAWGSTCECAPQCTYYKRTLGDAERRKDYV